MQSPAAVRGGGDRVQNLLELQGITVSYKNNVVVHDVSLDVAEGEVVALVGPSGAGKSSLLRTINFLEVPHSGTVVFDGAAVEIDRRWSPSKRNRKLVQHRRRVGMVFQHFNLFPHLTALENVALAQIHTLGRSKDEARSRALLELRHVGLDAHADKRPAQCSGGQQQRIAIARALALDPKVMLFDEPTSALDPELGMEVLTTMKRLADEGMTMLVVTHEMHFAEEVSNRLIFMADGRIVEHGPASQIMRNPQSDRARQFFAAVRGR